MLRLLLLLVFLTGAAKPSYAGDGWSERIIISSPEQLADTQSQELQKYGDLFERMLYNRIAVALRRLPENIAKQLEDKPTEDILVEKMSAHRVRDAVLSEMERAILKDAIQRGIWDTIKEVLNLILDAIRLSMDPTNLGDFNFHFQNDVIVGNLSVKSLTVGHLHDIQFEKYEIHPLQMCVGVDFYLPTLTLQTDYYDVDVTLDTVDDGDSKFPVFGAGPGRIELFSIKLHTDICVEILQFSVEVRNMKISVENDMVDLQNLFGGGAISDLINGMATDVVPAMIDELQPQLVDFLMSYINRLIKNILPSPGKTTSLPPTKSTKI